LRLSILSTSTKIFLFSKSTKFFLAKSLFFLFFSFTTLNYLLDFYQDVITISFHNGLDKGFYKSIF